MSERQRLLKIILYDIIYIFSHYQFDAMWQRKAGD